MARFKEILQSLQTWGENNPQIQYVGWGKIDELQNLADYPTMFIVPTPSEFNRNQQILKFDIYFLDKVRHDNINRMDAYNDMQLLASDLLSYYDINWFHNNGFYIDYPATYDLVDGDKEDYVSGIILSIDCYTDVEIDCKASNING